MPRRNQVAVKKPFAVGEGLPISGRSRRGDDLADHLARPFLWLIRILRCGFADLGAEPLCEGVAPNGTGPGDRDLAVLRFNNRSLVSGKCDQEPVLPSPWGSNL